nr:uncharacterized protein LOC123773156 [Procambarus clarkii]
MAEVLTIVAEEMGRVFGMVWSGVGVAIRLNNQVMTTVLKASTRIVQVLLLLTHKAADLFSVLTTDLLLFLGDIGNAVFALGMGVHAVVTTLFNFVSGILLGIIAAAMFSCQLVQASYCAIISGVMTAVAQVGNILRVLKHALVLFGSSIVFIIGLVPNVLCLVFTGLVHLCSYAYLNCSQAVNSSWLSLQYAVNMCVSGIITFVHDIPLEAVVGVVMGLALIIGLKYALFYMMDNMILVPDMQVPTMFIVTRQRLIRWYMAVVRRAHERPPVDIDTEEEELDDANDENGNDNNDNVPDLNLPQNQFFAHQMNMANPAPNQAHEPNIFPLMNGGEVPRNPAPAPLLAVGLTRRPIARQRMHEQPRENIALSPESSISEIKNGRESTNRADGQAYQLYRELEQEREGRLCIVCQDQVKCVILLPCRHLCLCDACRSAIITRDNTCPVCRRPIMETLRVYV